MSAIECPGAVEKRARPRRYTLGELCRLLRDAALTRFLGRMVLCHDPRLCALSLILGLVVLDFLARHSLAQLLGMACSTLLFHGLLYCVLRRYVRFLPYEELIVRRINSSWSRGLGIHVASGLAHCINRCVATAQFLLFGPDIRASLLLGLVLLEVRSVLRWISFSTLIKIAYCMAFALPKLWEALLLYLDLHPFVIRHRLLVQLLQSFLSKEFIFGLLEELGKEVDLYSARYFELRAEEIPEEADNGRPKSGGGIERESGIEGQSSED
ncbi:uncharacterized protein LOC108027484 isoform X2 [Drosophila biarmipes]|uniref:uncharacterized protein LOC108027484 isoform X2 n=1 Tax=Drosophila biarmipes TaxID=125945 RepID=UPI0007E7B898|nr:uncharacterized protein LOC108027484 isoform X2 [Drosophila biarmipes]